MALDEANAGRRPEGATSSDAVLTIAPRSGRASESAESSFDRSPNQEESRVPPESSTRLVRVMEPAPHGLL